MAPILCTQPFPYHQASNPGFAGWLLQYARRTCPASLLILLLTQVLLAQPPGWKNITPDGYSPYNDLNTGIFFIDAHTGVAIVGNGNLMRTTDGGETWTNAPSPKGGDRFYGGYFDIYFPSASIGYTVGGNCVIIKTVNGGSSWTRQSNIATTRDKETLTLKAVHFSDDNTGIIVGSWGTILKTMDGGATWMDVPNPYQGTNTAYKGVHFVDAQRGYVVGDPPRIAATNQNGVILKTTDGGSTWTEQADPVGIVDSRYEDVFFANANTGYVSGYIYGAVAGADPPRNSYYGVAKTTDGGQSWHVLQGSERYSSKGIDFLDEQTGFAAGKNLTNTSYMGTTTDGGQSWPWDSFYSFFDFNDVQFLQVNRGYIAGTSVYRYTGPIICTPATLTFPSSGGNRSTALIYPDNWTLTVNDPWLTVDKTSGRGNATLTVTATQANPTGDVRTGTITLSDGTYTQTLTLTQERAPATLSVSTTALSFPDTYQEQTFEIVSNATTTVTSNLPGINVDPNPAFGNRTVLVRAFQNLSAKSRSGTLTVTGGGLTRIITLTQAGGATHLALSKHTLFFSIEGGSGSFNVESNNDWLISGQSNWLTLSAGSGTDNAAVTVSATPFAGVGSRSCTLTVTAGNKTEQILISQAGIAPALSVSPANFSFSADSTVRTVAVSSNADWQVRTSAAWLVVSLAGGSGNGSFTLTALASTTALSRSGTVTVFVPGTELEEVISISQSRSFLNPTRLSFAALAEGKPLEVLNGGTWSLSSSESWLTTSLTSHTGTATVTVSAATNPGPAVRTGKITLTYAGGSRTQTVFVSQQGTAPPARLSQSITFAPLPAKTTADAPFALTATASSGLAISYRSSNMLVVTVSGNVLTLVREGTAIITAAQGGDANYLPAPEMSQTLTVGAQLVNTWRGTDTWSNAARWSEGAAPSLTADGLVASGTATVSGTAQVGTLTIAAGAVVQVPAGSTLLISGDLINKGGTLGGSGRVRFTKAGMASLTGPLAVATTVEVGPGTTLSTGNNLTLQEGAILLHGAGTPGGGGSVSGNITSRRIGKTGAYNGWSSPVSSAPASLLGGTVYRYDESRPYADYQRWLPASGMMQPGKGYFALGAGSVSFTGTANEGTFSLPLSYTPSHPSGERGFNLVGNPYPGPIDYDAFIAANPKINGALYFWDDDKSTGAGYDNADYTVRTAAGVVAGPNSGTLAGSGISSHQGFFVQATTTTSSVTFTNAMRSGGANTAFFRTKASELQTLKLSLSGGGYYQQTLIAFAPDATSSHDRRYDAVSLKASAGLSFFSLLEGSPLQGEHDGQREHSVQGERYAIQTLPLLTTERVVKLGVEVSENGSYSIGVVALQALEATFQVLLEDKLTGQYYDLRKQNQQQVNLTAGQHLDRFVLRFTTIPHAPVVTPVPSPTPTASPFTAPSPIAVPIAIPSAGIPLPLIGNVPSPVVATDSVAATDTVTEAGPETDTSGALAEGKVDLKALRVFTVGNTIYVYSTDKRIKTAWAQLFDLKGRKLEEFASQPMKDKLLTFASKFEQGQLYLLRLVTNEGVVTKRVILGF